MKLPTTVTRNGLSSSSPSGTGLGDSHFSCFQGPSASYSPQPV